MYFLPFFFLRDVLLFAASVEADLDIALLCCRTKSRPRGFGGEKAEIFAKVSKEQPLQKQ